MDVVRAVQNYIDKMIKDVPGMKVLLLDSETTAVISSVFPQSYLLEHEVYLTSYLSQLERDKLASLKCICFVRPSALTLEQLVQELKQPKYSEYYICTHRG